MVEIKGIPAHIITDIKKLITIRKEVLSEKARKISLRAGKVRIDDTPSIYLYSIAYLFPKSYSVLGKEQKVWRTIDGFVSLIANKDYLLRHESKSEEDEEKIVNSIVEHKIFAAPIMGGFRFNEHNKASKIIEWLHSCKPELVTEIKLVQRKEPRLQIHKIWRIKDPKVIRKLASIMEKVESVVILDGHHRYGALQSLRMKWIPMFLVDFDDENLILQSWHRLLKAPEEKVWKALGEILSIEGLRKYGTRLYKVKGIRDLRTATHLFKKNLMIKAQRRELFTHKDLEEKFKQLYWTRGGRPFNENLRQYEKELNAKGRELIKRPIGYMVQYTPEIIVAKRPQKEEFLYWERKIGVTDAEVERLRHKVYGFERVSLFGLYYIPGSSKGEKFYLLSVHAPISVFLKEIDRLVEKYTGVEIGGDYKRVDVRNELGESIRLVNKRKYDLAILTPVIDKSAIIKIAKRETNEIPAKLTCFLPKPIAGPIVCKIDDLK